MHKSGVVVIRIRPLGQEVQSVPPGWFDFPKEQSWQFEEVVEPMVVLNFPD